MSGSENIDHRSPVGPPLREPTPEDVATLRGSVNTYVDQNVEAVRARLDLCREIIETKPPLRFIAHYSSGVCNFALDALDEPGISDDDVTEARTYHRRMGIHLAAKMTELDRVLRRLGTGDLIRTVLHGSEGVVYCDSITPGAYVLGVMRHEQEPATDELLPLNLEVTEIDLLLAECVTTIRDRIRLMPRNPGAYFTSNIDRKDDPAVSDAGIADNVPSENPHEPATVRGSCDDSLAAICKDVIDEGNLHYVALFSSGTMKFSVDRLADRRLQEYSVDLSVADRRSAYDEEGRKVIGIGGQLTRLTSELIGRPLRRLVLDVEQGALYYYRITPSAYLLGVTVDQNAVREADIAAARISNEWQRLRPM